jgi:uncharacterized SAM-binding protein YcdF (DUF218 family)
VSKKIFTGLGILLILYWFGISLFIGFGQMFSYIWLAGGIFLIIFGRMPKSAVKKVLAGLMIVSLCACAALEIPIIRGAVSEPDSNADYVIVLGAKVNGTKPSRVLRQRLDAAIEYAEQNKNAEIIVTGGKGADEAISEAEAMKNYLVKKGIAGDRIITENKAADTGENLELSKNIIGDTDKSIVIVTSDFHMYRAVKIAEQTGFSRISGLPARTDAVLAPNYYIREAFGIIKYFML